MLPRIPTSRDRQGQDSSGVFASKARTPRSADVWTVGIAVVAIALSPSDAWVWTPGTHAFLSDAILRSLSLLPAGVAALLRSYPLDFIYGSIAADTTIAKKYAPEGRHCH